MPKGREIYQLASGLKDLEIQAVDHKSLRTHFEPDLQSVKNVTFWVDPLEPPDELRPEVITSKTRAGQALLHGHVLDSETGLPIKGARVRLERAELHLKRMLADIFFFYAPVPAIKSG